MDEASRSDFESFVAGNARSLQRYALGLCGNRADADDLVQEALLRVGLRWKHVTRRGDPLPYVRTVIARLHISMWRRARRQLLRASVVKDAAIPQDDRLEGDQILADALATLGARQRAVVVLTEGYGMSAAEVSELLGCQESTVRSQRSRALARLRALAADADAAAPAVPTRPTDGRS